jgi:branched-chain amino acid transport system ATP-binding protein
MVEERLTEIARCLAAKPKLIMLDEVLAGLTASEISEVTDLVRKISSELNITILWVEHVLKALMKLADRLIVLNYGQKIADGAPEEVIKDKQVLESYLGGEAISLR